MRTGTYDWNENTKDHPALPGLVKLLQKKIAQTRKEQAAQKPPHALPGSQTGGTVNAARVSVVHKEVYAKLLVETDGEPAYELADEMTQTHRAGTGSATARTRTRLQRPAAAELFAPVGHLTT
jgi:hypothetical protein